MREATKRFRLLWWAHPLWALAETWVVGLSILFLLFRAIGHITTSAFGNGTLMLCGTCGMWMALRTRLPRTRPSLQILWELGVSIALSLLMAVGLHLSTNVLGWSDVWQQSNLGSVGTVLLLLTGAGYLVARGGVRVWLLWNRARRRRMIFSLTHAHLTVAIVVMALFALLTWVSVLWSGQGNLTEIESGGAMARIADRLFLTFMPLAGISGAVMIAALVVVLPPSAVFSYFVARRTTRRLKSLAETARAFREGEYGVRVDVTGKDEVAQLQSDFNAMAKELEQTLRDLRTQHDMVSHLLDSRRELMVSVSHELRTPVATLRAILESTLNRQDETPSPTLQHDLEAMEGEVLRLQRLIDDLFTLSQAEVEQLSMDCHPAPIVPIVRHIVDAMAPLAWDAGRVEVVAELPDELPLARVDESRLEQILANLLRNGIRHTPPGGIVAVMVFSEKDAIRIDVRDTGEGIPPEELPHIWERFYRGERARKDGRGTGLGLALVKELTEAMDGTVEVESAVGQGSRFTVRLPRA